MRLVTVLLLTPLLADAHSHRGCGIDHGPPGDGGAPDASPAPDAGEDAGVDAGEDAADAGTDATTEAPSVEVSATRLLLQGPCGGAAQSASFTITNPASFARTLTVSAISLSVDIGGVTVGSPSFIPIGPGETLTATVSWSPFAEPFHTMAPISIADEVATHTVQVETITTGATLTWSPPSIDFGDVPVLTEAAAIVTGQDQGILLDGRFQSNCGDQYTQLNIQDQPSSLPFLVTPDTRGPSCTWRVSFRPPAAGTYAATLAWSAAAFGAVCSPSPATMTVTGTGTP